MTLPTLAKVWQLQPGQPFSASGDARVDQQKLLAGIVNSVLAVPVGAPVVVGSSNGVAAACDGVNRWSTGVSSYHNVVFAADGSAHSWIVLRFGDSQVLIDCVTPGASGDTGLQMWLSFNGGGGFSGGSITSRPTAFDEVMASDSAVNGGIIQWLESGFSDIDRTLDVWVPTDGSGFRAVAHYSGGVDSWWIVEHAIDPVFGWLTPFVGGVIGGAPTFAALYRVDGPLWGRVLGHPARFGLSTEAIGSQAICERMTAANAISSKFPVTAAGLYTESIFDSTSQQGRHGRLADFWYGSVTPVDGDTYPGDASRLFKQIGNTVVPWDGSA